MHHRPAYHYELPPSSRDGTRQSAQDGHGESPFECDNDRG